MMINKKNVNVCLSHQYCLFDFTVLIDNAKRNNLGVARSHKHVIQRCNFRTLRFIHKKFPVRFLNRSTFWRAIIDH